MVGQSTSAARRTLEYDTNGDLTSIVDAFDGSLMVATDTSGRVLSLADSLGTIATYTYSGNHLSSVSYPDNSGFQLNYDGADRLTTVTDALGNIVESHT